MFIRDCTYLIVFSCCLRFGVSGADEEVQTTKDDEATCADKHDCLSLELGRWFSALQDKKASWNCNQESDDGKREKAVKPIFTVAKSCNEEGAIWQYKYQGSKGKKKVFKGKGKLKFTKSSNPPHGYDYGMKSGICLFLSNDDISSIEGTFEQGVLQGEAEVIYYDGKATRGTFVDGGIAGAVRLYEQTEEAKSQQKEETRLYSIGFYDGGGLSGSQWIMKEDGNNILSPLPGHEGLVLAVVPMENKTKYLVGKLEEEDMLIGASEARLLGIKDENCMKVPEVKLIGDQFDFDLQVKSVMKATTAKLVRFFETVTDDKVLLSDAFKAKVEEPVDHEKANYLLRVLRFDGKYYEVETRENGKGRASLDGLADKQDERNLNGIGTVKMLSDWKRKDVQDSVAKKKSNETEDNEADPPPSDDLVEYENTYLSYEDLPFRLSHKSPVIYSIKGTFVNNVLQGLATVKYSDGGTVEGFVVDGAFHGLVRHLAPPFTKGRRKRFIRRQVDNVVISTGLTGSSEPIKEALFVGSYKNGFIDGPGWKFLVGGCYLYGDFKQTLTFSTDHGAFINQDLETCYVGRFVDGKMMSGQTAKVIGQKTVDNIKVPMFTEPEGITYRFIQGENGKLTDPLTPDITEDNWVFVKQSPHGGEEGEGLFAKKDIPENTVVAFFGGIRYTASEWNETKPLDPPYWMKVDDGTIIHLPKEYGRSTDKYRATLAHKINHSFSKWNCMFHSLDHPRLGLIPAARTTENVAEDEELLCLYELKYHEGSPWFQELWRSQIDSDFVYGPFGHRGEKRTESEGIAPWLDNATLYQDFYSHAVNVLKLDPVT